MSGLNRIVCVSVFQLFVLLGCAARNPENPIPYEFFAGDSSPTGELIIFLPGRGDDLGAFQRAGFIESLLQSKRATDSVVVDAHFGYYKSGLVAERVYQDILLPFQQKGYKRFVVVGASLGGYGALWLNSEYPDLISGMVLLAPYLGRNPLIEKIEASGGVNLWRSQLDYTPGPDKPDELVWCWIDDLGNGEQAKIDKIMLAYGEKDRFSKAAGLLARSVPGSNVFINDGGHNWNTWKLLWDEVLQSNGLGTSAYTE
jgi:hypothetical protein